MGELDLTSGERLRIFAIITTDANELVAEIHAERRHHSARKALATLCEISPVASSCCSMAPTTSEVCALMSCMRCVIARIAGK